MRWAQAKPLGADLLVANGGAEAGVDRFEPLHQPCGVGALLGFVVRGAELGPGLNVAGGEGVHDVAALRCQGGIEQRGDRHEDHPLLAFHLGPVFKQKVVAVEAHRNEGCFHAQMQGEEGGGGLVAAPPPGIR